MRLSRTLFPIVVALLALPRLASAQPPGPQRGGMHGNDPRIEALRREIGALLLDKTLNLSQDQARTLLPILREAKAKRELLKADLENAQDEIVAALTQARDDLKTQGAVQPATSQRFGSLRAGVQKPEGKGELKRRIAALLTPQQKKALENFDPNPFPRPERGARGGQGGQQEGGGERKFIRAMIMSSDEFIQLVEARAK